MMITVRLCSLTCMAKVNNKPITIVKEKSTTQSKAVIGMAAIGIISLGILVLLADVGRNACG